MSELSENPAPLHITAKLLRVTLRPSIWRRADEALRRELELLLHELNTSSHFVLQVPPPAGGFELRLGLTGEHLIVAIMDVQGLPYASRSIPLEPLRSIIRSYLKLIARMGGSISSHASVTHFEALDMARRATHNEASEQIQRVLDGMLKVDLETARRLFTILCLVYDFPAR